ncbi:hypothetical protein EI42_05909 [Thermosporothrix hazakensis]|jgi:hypothetical protein|uniref:Uncharacterized protein n=1 Tax=Thermosporothrix hazakensis TaxID=644383 RepID=A0A326TWQ3_THEHA|nr:hypothetical protein EI42_05909 [Thermosporothrix hazakensis]GCE51464.1 hypothetical protein KTH_63330 [Thermosporothrix hazakensis]
MPLLINCFIILLIVLGIIISIALNRPLARVLERYPKKNTPEIFYPFRNVYASPYNYNFY